MGCAAATRWRPVRWPTGTILVFFRNPKVGKIQSLITVNQQNVRRAARRLLVIRFRQSPQPRLTVNPLIRSKCDIARLFSRIRNLADCHN
jgi:hypothetical protein